MIVKITLSCNQTHNFMFLKSFYKKYDSIVQNSSVEFIESIEYIVTLNCQSRQTAYSQLSSTMET